MEVKLWKQFYHKTKGLTKINSFEKLISKEQITQYQSLLKDVLSNFLNKKELHLGLKTYVNHELRGDLNEAMINTPIEDHDELYEWCKEIFGQNRFGLILNYLELQSDEFARTAAKDVQPLLELAGLPLGGISFLFFMGNYGFTPFGIHKEANGEEGFLFHLGPGTKQFYAWDAPEYNEIPHNTEVFHDIENWLPKATCYTLEPGDAMFIPHNVFHIANTDEFSLSFVMDYINPPTEVLESTLIKNIGEQKINNPENRYCTPLKMDEPQINWKKKICLKSFEQKIEHALEKHIYKLKSNGGIIRSATQNKITVNIAPNCHLQLIPPFKIFYKEINAETLIFIRGHEYVTKTNKNLPEVLEQINKGKKITVEYLKSLLLPDWDLIRFFDFIFQLLQKNAIYLKHEDI